MGLSLASAAHRQTSQEVHCLYGCEFPCLENEGIRCYAEFIPASNSGLVIPSMLIPVHFMVSKRRGKSLVIEHSSQNTASLKE